MNMFQHIEAPSQTEISSQHDHQTQRMDGCKNVVDSGQPSFQDRVHTALFQVASFERLVPKSLDSLPGSPNPSAAHTGVHVHVKCRQDELCQVLSKHEDMLNMPIADSTLRIELG